MVKMFHIASWSSEGGIYRIGFDFACGKVTYMAKAAPGSHTSYFETAGDILYVLSEIGGPGDMAGKIESFHVTEKGLEPIDQMEGIPSGAPHIRLSDNDKTMYVASYTTGTVCSLDVSDGHFGKLTSLLNYSGHGADLKRQEGPHAHMMCNAPDGKYVVCVDLGTDELRVYALGQNGGMRLHGTVKAPAGYGPRHMVFSQDGNYAYVVCELRYRVLTYRYLGNGAFLLANDLDVIPKLSAEQNWGGAIKLSKDGTLLFTSNRGRGCSSIDILGLERPEAPYRIGSFSECEHPRDFALVEAEGHTYLICLDMVLNRVAFYRFNRETMAFTYLDSVSDIPMPVCVI